MNGDARPRQRPAASGVRLLRACLLVVGLALVGVAFAQEGALGGAGEATGGQAALEFLTGVPVDAAQRVRKVVVLVESRVDKLRTNGALAEAGKYLLGTLAAVTITWSILKNMVLKPGLPQLLADLVFPGVVLALGLTAINGQFADAIARLVQSTALALSATPPPTDSVAAAFVARCWDMLVAVWSTQAPFDFFELGVSMLRGLVLQAVATLFIVAAAATGVAMLFVAKLQVALACALAPVMIPWLLWRPAEFLFTGWLTFLLRGGFVAVAVFMIERVMFEAMQAVTGLAVGVAPGFDSSLVYGSIGMLALVFAFLMLKAGEIGAGLVGGAVVGLGGFHAMAGRAATPLRAAMQLAAARAGGGAPGGMRAVVSVPGAKP